MKSERERAYMAEWRKNHPGYSSRKAKEWREKNPRWKADVSSYRKRKMAEDPLWDKRRFLKHRYKITLEQYEAMYREQNGGCKICGGLNVAGRMLAVDHDHRTGQVRGLLCSRCNMAIGLFKDDLDLIRTAFEYVEGVLRL